MNLNNAIIDFQLDVKEARSEYKGESRESLDDIVRDIATVLFERIELEEYDDIPYHLSKVLAWTMHKMGLVSKHNAGGRMFHYSLTEKAHKRYSMLKQAGAYESLPDETWKRYWELKEILDDRLFLEEVLDKDKPNVITDLNWGARMVELYSGKKQTPEKLPGEISETLGKLEPFCHSGKVRKVYDALQELHNKITG